MRVVGEHSTQRRRWDVNPVGACRKANVGISNEMNEETFTPKTQGFLNNAKRIRVSRGLRRTRKGYLMTNWLIFQYSLYRLINDREVTLPPPDGIGG